MGVCEPSRLLSFLPRGNNQVAGLLPWVLCQISVRSHPCAYLRHDNLWTIPDWTEKNQKFSHIMVPYIRRRKTTCNHRRNITLNVVHFQSRLSRKKMLFYLSSHFKIACLALIWESAVLRLRANTINQHLRTCVVLYFEVPVGTFGWHFIIPQSSFYRGRITQIL